MGSGNVGPGKSYRGQERVLQRKIDSALHPHLCLVPFVITFLFFIVYLYFKIILDLQESCDNTDGSHMPSFSYISILQNHDTFTKSKKFTSVQHYKPNYRLYVSPIFCTNVYFSVTSFNPGTLLHLIIMSSQFSPICDFFPPIFSLFIMTLSLLKST